MPPPSRPRSSACGRYRERARLSGPPSHRRARGVWEGTSYSSLSAIARAITGTVWNGPRFFCRQARPRKRFARARSPPRTSSPRNSVIRTGEPNLAPPCETHCVGVSSCHRVPIGAGLRAVTAACTGVPGDSHSPIAGARAPHAVAADFTFVSPRCRADFAVSSPTPRCNCFRMRRLHRFNPSYWRARADELRAVAAQATDPKVKATTFGAADAYDKLAQLEKASPASELHEATPQPGDVEKEGTLLSGLSSVREFPVADAPNSLGNCRGNGKPRLATTAGPAMTDDGGHERLGTSIYGIAPRQRPREGISLRSRLSRNSKEIDTRHILRSNHR
jgi:hypothetical protein